MSTPHSWESRIQSFANAALTGICSWGDEGGDVRTNAALAFLVADDMEAEYQKRYRARIGARPLGSDGAREI